MQKTRYPGQQYDCYALTAQEAQVVLAKGLIPRLELSLDLRGVTVAVLPAVEKHPDRAEPDYAIPEFYVEALVQNGARPILVGFDEVTAQLDNIRPQAIMLPGGDFCFPQAWISGAQPENGTLRREQAYEAMITYAEQHHLPLLAICAGEQVLAGMFGAKLQAVEGHRQAPDNYSHNIQIAPGSLLAKLSGMSEYHVNTNHHLAAVTEPNCACTATARSTDGVVEAIELKHPWHWFVLGVQWHPERFINRADELTERIFAGFVKAARGGVSLTRETVPFAQANMVEIRADEHFIVDMMYARTDNISGQAVYRQIGLGAKAYVRAELWERLQKIVPWLEQHNLKLKICDAYRPLAAHMALKAAIHEQGPGLFASCGEVSKHCHGTAVDVVLCHADGSNLAYPTPVDCYVPRYAALVQKGETKEFYEYAKQGRQDYQNPRLTAEIANREQLRQLMESVGLSAISSEWWHYEMPDEYNLAFPVVEWK